MIFYMIVKVVVISLLVFGMVVYVDQLVDIKVVGKIVIVIDMYYVFFDMLKNGIYEGMIKDLFDEVFKEIGVELVYQDIFWIVELLGFEVKKFDIVIVFVIIIFEWFDCYIFILFIVDVIVLLVKIVNSDLIKFEDIKGKIVGVQ